MGGGPLWVGLRRRVVSRRVNAGLRDRPHRPLRLANLVFMSGSPAFPITEANVRPCTSEIPTTAASPAPQVGSLIREAQSQPNTRSKAMSRKKLNLFYLIESVFLDCYDKHGRPVKYRHRPRGGSGIFPRPRLPSLPSPYASRRMERSRPTAGRFPEPTCFGPCLRRPRTTWGQKAPLWAQEAGPARLAPRLEPWRWARTVRSKTDYPHSLP